MDVYTFYYSLKVCNSKDTTKTIEQPAHKINMVQKHHYLIAMWPTFLLPHQLSLVNSSAVICIGSRILFHFGVQFCQDFGGSLERCEANWLGNNPAMHFSIAAFSKNLVFVFSSERIFEGSQVGAPNLSGSNEILLQRLWLLS